MASLHETHMAVADSIRFVAIKTVHGHQDVAVTLNPGLSIIHGKNGTGKTTILHVLANLLDADIERFCHLVFDQIRVEFSSGRTISLYQKRAGDEVQVDVSVDDSSPDTVVRGSPIASRVAAHLRHVLPLQPVYLPAFRSMLDATGDRPGQISYRQADKEFETLVQRARENLKAMTWQYAPFGDQAEIQATKTILCRNWFGPFVPLIRYPSLQEVSIALTNEVQTAFARQSSNDQRILNSAFVHVLEVMLSGASENSAPPIAETLASIQRNLKEQEARGTDFQEAYSSIANLVQKPIGPVERTSSQLRPLLQIYENAISSRSQFLREAYSLIDTFTASVNRFFEGKRIVIDAKSFGRRFTYTFVELPTDERCGFQVLSSGERQVLTLLFSATHLLPSTSVVLLDEPEISLHVDWQRIILSEMMKLAGDRQIIVCTHSPEVAGDHRQALVQIHAMPTRETPVSAEESESIEQQ
jgi:ABC-type lipoprotein export system ATPase subunit